MSALASLRATSEWQRATSLAPWQFRIIGTLKLRVTRAGALAARRKYLVSVKAPLAIVRGAVTAGD